MALPRSLEIVTAAATRHESADRYESEVRVGERKTRTPTFVCQKCHTDFEPAKGLMHATEFSVDGKRFYMWPLCERCWSGMSPLLRVVFYEEMRVLMTEQERALYPWKEMLHIVRHEKAKPNSQETVEAAEAFAGPGLYVPPEIGKKRG